MSSIQTGIELNDQFSGVLNNIISSVNLAVSAMADMQQSMNADIDTSSLQGARDEINQATAALNELNDAMQQDRNIQPTAPQVEQTAPDIAPPVVDGGNQEPIPVQIDPVLPDPLIENPDPVPLEVQPNAPPDIDPVEVPVTWQTDNLDVFTGTGVERFQQEVQSANDMLNTLNTTQAHIAQTAQGMDILPDEAVQDMTTMQQRLSAIQQRIQQIENNPVNMGTDQANAELEQLRGQLNNAIQAQNELNDAMQNMDVSAANTAYLQLSQTVGNTERYIRDNVDEQGRFNQEIASGTQQANELTNTIKRAVAAYVSIQSVGKALDISDELTQTTSRLDMMNDGVQTTAELVNMVYAAAQDARGSFSQMADVVARFGNNAKDAFSSSEEVVAFADLIQKQMTIAGAVNRSAGSGFDGINAFGGRKRCNLTNDGRVAAYYGEAGFSTTGKLTQAVDRNPVGTESPDENLKFSAGTIVQVMVEQPKFYYKVVPLKTEKRTKGAITRKIRYYVSDTPKAGFKLHPAFIVNGQENDVAYLAAFEGSLWDASASAYILDDSQVADFAADMLCSIANAKPLSGLTQNATRANIRKLAEKRGTGWEQGVVQTASASQMLMLIEYATFNMQSVIGNGAVSKTDDGKTSMTENTGATITLGNASGSVVNANGIQIVSYRGEENFWGNIWWWIDGINHYANATTGECDTYVADHGFTDDSKAAPYEDTGMCAKYGNGYISAFCYSEDFDWLFLPGEFNGNTALPVGDYCWNQNGTGWRVAILGAGWNGGLGAGAFCWTLVNASSDRYRAVGGRLVYRKKVAA